MTPPPKAVLFALALCLSGCGGAFAESSQFVYGPLAGSDAEIFEQLHDAIVARGHTVLESDPQAGRVVVAIRAVRGHNGAAQVVFQCYRGGYVRSTVPGAEALDGTPHRIRLRREVRDGYEEIAVGLVDALRLGDAQSGGEASR